MARETPREWRQRVRSVVFGCLVPGELRVILHPGAGLADGGVPRDVPTEAIPADLRMPNTPLWIDFDDDWTVLRAWRRRDDE